MKSVALVPIGLALALIAGPGASMSILQAGVQSQSQDSTSGERREISMTDASTEEVAKAVQNAGPKSRGGQWEWKTEVVSAEIPGATVDMIAEMKKKGATSLSQCYADGELNAQGGPLGKVDDSCRFANFRMGKGALSATTRCKMPEGEVIANVNGTFSEDRFDYEIQTNASMGEQSMKMTMKIAGRRTGDCTPEK
jgi:hypothetical protein